MKKKYLDPRIGMTPIQTEGLMNNPASVTENGQTSPDMGIGGDSPGGQEADSKRGLFDSEASSRSLWDD